MNNCTKNDCGWCYDKSGLSNDDNGQCNNAAGCQARDWPTEEAINATGLNGECDEPVYEMLGHLYRINPVNNYALVFTGKKWTESQRITNEMVRLNGWVKSN